MIKGVHHIAVICSNYDVSRHFYTEVLGFTVIAETYREERQSHKLDLALNGHYLLELFSFPSPPARTSNPEATGLRHIAFTVETIEKMREHLHAKNIITQTIRIDAFTGKKFFFIEDPDGLPIEFYES
ncbi:MAG: VOC family protein [Bacteroidota bacterium]